MMPKMRIFHKGLLLVAIPLIFEILFVGILVVALKRTEYEIWSYTMPNTRSSQHSSVESTTLQIADRGAILTLDYAGARATHDGDSWWGVAVGFRAMQVAAGLLSQSELWDRDQLHVVSGHPGPGVRHAIDYVTRSVERKRFHLLKKQSGGSGCSRDMKYEWWLEHCQMTAVVRLRPKFVPEPFYNLLDRLGGDHERQRDHRDFDVFKADLEARIWHEPLAASFSAECLPIPLNIGERPDG